MSETSAEAPATDAPGDKVYICPACGTRYDQPTECANAHPPTETVEYDRATVEAADSGDESAIASVNETAAQAAGTSAGAVQSETAVGDPAPPEPMPAAPAAPAPPAKPAPADIPAEQTPHGQAFAKLEAAVAELKTALGI